MCIFICINYVWCSFSTISGIYSQFLRFHNSKHFAQSSNSTTKYIKKKYKKRVFKSNFCSHKIKKKEHTATWATWKDFNKMIFYRFLFFSFGENNKKCTPFCFCWTSSIVCRGSIFHYHLDRFLEHKKA